MLAVTLQRLESRFEQFLATHNKLQAEHDSLVMERDNLLRERQFMREELDRILARFAKIDEESS
jgi:hypothetical protein